jgi:hypothetical protein
MRYQEARDQIQTGDLLTFGGGDGFFSKLISFWGGVKSLVWKGRWRPDRITHVGMAIWVTVAADKEPKLCVLEPRAFQGVRLVPLSHVLCKGKKQHYRVYWQPIISEISKIDAADYAMRHWAKAYASVWQFVVIAFSAVQWCLKAFGWNLDLSADRFHCSELATRSLMSAGYHHLKNPAMTTPQMVSEFRCLGHPTLLEWCNDA